MRSTDNFLHHNTPEVTVMDNRGLTVRTLRYHRHPDSPSVTDERITRHQFNTRGQLTHSIDPRLFALQQANTTVKPNFSYVSLLTGDVLRTDSVDAGTTVTLNDIAGRPVISVSAIGVTQTFQYEEDTLPGRLLSITEQVPGDAPRITERFIWAGNSPAAQDLNLAGQLVRHYDTSGRRQTDSLALTGTPLSLGRQLLLDAAEADWQHPDESDWQDLLAPEFFITRSTVDATGAVLTTTDAKGNRQRLAYDIAGQLLGSWLTLNGETEQVIVASLTYSAAGQKLQEVHGNGVVTTYTYEPETHRLTGIKTARLVGHASGARVLQDLRYTYDPVGNVVKVTNDAEVTRFWRNQKVVPENTYVYDSLYQLVSATGREMASIGQQGSQLPAPLVPLPTDDGAYANYTRTYLYDQGDNLYQIRHSAPAAGNNYTTDITVSSRSNRSVLSSLTEDSSKVDGLFDACGHQLQLLLGQDLHWNVRGELQRVTPVIREGAPSDHEQYRYGSDGMRVSKVSAQLSGNNTQTQRTRYLPGLELRTTHQGEALKEELHTVTVGEAGLAQVRVLHWSSGLPADINNNQVRYSYDNLIGNSGLEVDSKGELISLEEYYPYGGTAAWAARSQVEASYKTRRYSGKERDATGLYYYGYRYYQSWVGRWLSADPAGTVDGVNLFRMVRNNPVRFKDVVGLSPDDDNKDNGNSDDVKTLYTLPIKFKLPLPIEQRLSKSLSNNKPKYNILFISAKPNPFSFDPILQATTDFSKQKINYLMHKGHNVKGAYASSVKEFTDTWNSIGKKSLKGIDKVIIDYHGSISPKRNNQSVVVLSEDPLELLDKSAIDKLESHASVKVVSLYACYSGFVDRYNPAVGLLEKLTIPEAHAVGFDAQSDSVIDMLKTIRHSEAGPPFDKALSVLKINRTQYGRVKYTKSSETEINIKHQWGNLKYSGSDALA
ncbi:RHS repeat domain-containing protein [Yersinia kristensenii]|uniref:RHS repeat domain-containing protein n=1 Tax=Yersinia kristensenii TaxID=28152 RepID=UPI0005E0B9BC|nr:RHS repeat domain-containing protein [Yersinia kristensenii]CNF36084.1 toxin protein [Yersinia kristensenii]